MIDQYGRTIDYLRLSVTDLCNYRCQYCMPADGVEKGPHGAVLSVEEYGEIARAAVKLGIRKIRLTGGEPLVRRGILDICRTLRAIPELKELCLTTNGSLLPELAKPLQEAGVDHQSGYPADGAIPGNHPPGRSGGRFCGHPGSGGRRISESEAGHRADGQRE